MATTTYTPPTREPAELVAGDSWRWDRTVEEFPPSGGWSLIYYFNGPSAFSVTAATSSLGDYFEVREAAATNAARTAGNYRVSGYATGGADRFLVFDGRVQVHPNLATAAATVTHARRMLTQIEEALEAVTPTSGTFAKIAVNGREVTYDHAGLMKMRGIYAAMVAAEENPRGRFREIPFRFARR
jgi:hypothetical protein